MNNQESKLQKFRALFPEVKEIKHSEVLQKHIDDKEDEIKWKNLIIITLLLILISNLPIIWGKFCADNNISFDSWIVPAIAALFIAVKFAYDTHEYRKGMGYYKQKEKEAAANA